MVTLDPTLARSILVDQFPNVRLEQVGVGHHSIVFRVYPDFVEGADSPIIVRIRKAPTPSFPWNFYKSLVIGEASVANITSQPIERNGYEISTVEYLTEGSISQENYINFLTTLHSTSFNRGEAPEWRWLERTKKDLNETRGAHIELLWEIFHRATSRLELIGVGHIAPIHGDPHLGNIGFDSDGRSKWFDLDDICAGPVAWDWSSVIFLNRRFGNNDWDLNSLENAAHQDCGDPRAKLILDAMVTLRELSLILAGFRLLDSKHYPKLLHRVSTLQSGDKYERWTIIDDL